MTVATEHAIGAAGEALVRQYAGQLAKKIGTPSEARVLILRAQPTWSAAPRIPVNDATGREWTIVIRPCVSSLAVREAMQERGADELLVVLTDRSDSDLGLGILARCYDQRTHIPSMWEGVKEAFRAREVDSALARMDWAKEPLVLNAPAGGWPVPPTGVLLRDHALSHLTGALLHMPPTELDPSGILQWTLDRPGTANFRAQSESVQKGIIEWVGDAIGPVAALALRSAVQPHSIDALSIGLAIDVLWAADTLATPEVVSARTRLEQFTGVRNLAAPLARAFADASRGLLQRLALQRDPAYPGILARATALFADLEYAAGTDKSTVLPAGHQARLRAFAQQVQGFVRGDRGSLNAVEAAFVELLQHEQSGSDSQTPVARMALRLCRWLALPTPEAATDLAAATLQQAREFAFVDWAAADVWVGSGDPAVSAAWSALFESARARRLETDRRFASLLADATSRGVLPDSLVPLERLIVTTLKPMASRGNRALVILVDGMSVAVAAELAEETLRAGWFEVVPAASMARTASLAVLPTLTKYSRTSFFCGALTTGGQAEERAGFAALAGGQVFHKADLVGDAGHVLPSTITTAIASDTSMVAVVLNTVDDTLAKADPGGTDWTVSTIQHLQPLLEEASRAGRIVVLVSDHGHVVERGGRALAVAGADARFRPVATGEVDPASEVQLTGNRVLAEGGTVLAAFAEDMRYGSKQAGYHGGASAAEVVIPVIVLSRQPDDLSALGWAAAAPQAPAWWNDHVVSAALPRPTVAAPARVPDTGQLGIELPEAEPVEPAAARVAREIDQLLASDMYAAQRARYGARAVPDDVVRKALDVLLRQGGRAHRDTVATAIGIPAQRLPGVLASLRRQLNVEGYEVLTMDVDDVTVLLNVALLREQFMLGAGA